MKPTEILRPMKRLESRRPIEPIESARPIERPDWLDAMSDLTRAPLSTDRASRAADSQPAPALQTFTCVERTPVELPRRLLSGAWFSRPVC